MRSLSALVLIAFVADVSCASPVLAAEERAHVVIDSTERLALILDQDLNVEKRTEVASELFASRDIVMMERLFELATKLDAQGNPSDSRVSSRIIQAYWEIQVEIASTDAEKISLLVAALESKGDRRFGWARSWAALRLCDRGLSFAWDEMEPVLRRAWGDEGLAVCERKIKLVESCGGNLLKAWEKALKTEDTFPSRPIFSWAEHGLRDSPSREAGEILLRFYVRQLPQSFWTLTYIARDLKKRGWTDEELREFGWTGRPFPGR